MIVRKESPEVHRTLHYKLYKSGKYLVTSAIMGLSVLGALTFDNPTKVHADSTAKDQIEETNEDGNAVTTTSTSPTSQIGSNNEQSVYADSEVAQETTPASATIRTPNSNSTANNLGQGQDSTVSSTNHINVVALNASLQQNTQSSQNEKSLMTNMAVSNEAAKTDVINKVNATGVTPNTNQVIALTDYGALGDGQTDDTQALQEALDSINQAGGGILDIPAGNYMVNTTNATNEAEATIPWQTNQGVKVPSNTTLYFEKGAKFSVIPNASWNYCLLNLTNSKNVNILNGELIGDRDKHDTKYTKNFRTTTKYQGETGWGILMTGAQNVNIIGNNIHDFWGDGIDLYGDNANPGVNQNIVIKNNTLNHNRRQGISVENVNGLVFDHNLVENTDGTAPRAGMDIEPANFKDPSMRIAHDITITNNTFRNNNGSGLMTYGLSTHAEGFSDGPSRISNLTIKNNTFDGNNTNSFAVEGTASEGAWNWQQNMNGQLTVLGTSNATVENNKFINPNPKGINIDEANGDTNAVIAANTYKTAGIFMGFNENAQIHNNYLQGQDIFVTGNQSPSYAFNNISGSVTNNYANAVIANGTLDDATKKAVVPDGQNYKDTIAAASFISSTGAPESNSYQNKLKQATNADTIINEVRSYGVTPVTKNVVTVTDYGIIGDGNTDITDKLESILNQVGQAGGGIVYFPAGYYMINGTKTNVNQTQYISFTDGLNIPSNTTLLLDSKAVVETIANSDFASIQFRIENSENVNVLGGTFLGDRATHKIDQTSTQGNNRHYAGECGFGLDLSGAKNIVIKGSIFKQFWGDGINVYHNPAYPNAVNQNVLIDGCVFDSNRRQGISVETVNGLQITNSQFIETGVTKIYDGRQDDGTSPRAGIDLEPDEAGGTGTRNDSKYAPLKRVENVEIDHNIFDHNEGAAIMTTAMRNNIVPLVINNINIHDNDMTNNNRWGHAQIQINATDHATIKNNTINNTDNLHKHAIWLGWSTNFTVDNNKSKDGDIVVNPSEGQQSFAIQQCSGTVINNKASAINLSSDWGDAVTQSNNVANWNGQETERVKQATNANAIINEAKSYGVTPVTKNVVTVADYGITGDSTTDVTAKIQTVLDQVKNNGGGIVYVPAGTYMIRADDQEDPVLGWQNNKDGLQVGPNTTILLDKNAVLKVIANPASGYTVLNLINADNSNVLGGTIQGDRYSHLLTTPFNIRNGEPFYGEWGTGINVTGGDHVSLIGTVYKDCWGDGIQVFPGMKTWKTDKQATNLLIKNNVFDHNRRQGVSLGNVNGAVLEGNLFQNTNGTGPASGLDLEPGGDLTEVVENVTIKNNIFQNNTNQGLTMYAAPGTHVRNIKVLNNTFANNGSWITGQVNIQQAENVEVAYNHVISDDGSRFYGIDSIGSSNVNIHDNYLPNGSIVITKDNPAAGFPTPSGSVKNNYVSSVTIEHNGFEQNNNGSPSQADVSIRSKTGADWNATDNTTHPDTITNEKLTLTGFNSRGKTYNVTENPQDTILGNYDPMNWKGTFSFDIDSSLLRHKSTGDDVVKFEKPMFTLYHNQDDQANLGTDVLYLGNQGKPIYINGQNVGTLYSSYIISNGTFKGSGIQHVTVDNIDMGDGRLHINGVDHKTANETIITTADGKKYGFSFRAADGTLNIPEDKSLNDTTKPDIPVIPTEEIISKTITMNFVWGDESNHFTLMNDGSNIVYAGINGQSGTAVTAPVHIKLTEKHENNQWILASAKSDNPNVKVSIDRINLLKPKVDINPQYHGITLVTDSKAPLSDSVNEFVLDLNPALTKDQMFSTFKSEYTTKVYVPKVKFSINYQNEATGKIIGSQLYQGDLTPDGAILKLNNQVPEGYQLDPNHSGDQVRWIGDKYLLELHKQSGWTTITNDMGKPDANGSATYTSLLTESIIPIHKASLTYQFVDDNNNGANVGNPVVITGNVNSVQQVSELSVPTNYQLAAGQSLPTSVQIPQNNDTLKIHLVHVTQSVSDSKIIYRIINVTDPSGKATTTKQSITINRQGTKDLVTNQTSWDKWSTASLPEYNVPVIAGYQASQIKVAAQPVTADSQDSTININYVANAQTANLVYKDGNKVVKTVPLTGKTGDTVDVNIAIPEHYHAINQVPKSYTFKAERNADVVIQLGHDTQATSGFKTVTRTINVTEPNGKVTTTKQSATINRQGTKDLVTNQITWNDWSTTSLPEYDVPALDGYQATQNKVATQPVTSDSQDSVINIAYTVNKQAVNVFYKDGNQIIKTVPLTGKTGETVKVPIDVPVNYHLTNQPADSYTFKANSNPDIVVELAHDMQSADDFKVITRVIKIIRPDGQVVTETQKATVTRTGSKDAVTGEIAWNNWSTAKWDRYNATKILGYTSTMPIVSGQVVTSDTPDTTVEVKYVANPQQANIIYKDGNQVIKKTALNGKTDETVDVKLDLPEHYHVINQVAKAYTFKADHNNDVIVELGHDIQQVSDSHTINRTINLISPDGTKKAIKQSASINRMGAKDLVTGDINWSDWSDAQLPEYMVPVLDGYTASQSEVAAETVTSDTQDSTVNITYAANQQSVNIIYKDDNQVVKTAVLTGKTDETVKVSVEQPTNYHIDGKTPTDYTFKAKENQNIVINLGHDTQTVTQSKTVKRTINLELPGETDKPIAQQVTFTRHGIKDLVTGKTTWGSWNHNGKYQFDSYTPEIISGYKSDPIKVNPLLVTPNSKDSEVTISYHKLVANSVVKPEGSRMIVIEPKKTQQTQKAQPFNYRKNNNVLPHTGNNNKLLAGTIMLGVVGVMLIPNDRKRY